MCHRGQQRASVHVDAHKRMCRCWSTDQFPNIFWSSLLICNLQIQSVTKSFIVLSDTLNSLSVFPPN